MPWQLTGNNGINPNTNFLGTTDNQPLVIKTNGAERMRFTNNGDVGIGTLPRRKLDVDGEIVATNRLTLAQDTGSATRTGT